MSAEPLHIAFVTSEMVPFVKTGGLADFSAALPKALVRLGHRLAVVLPRYRAIRFPPGEFAGSVPVPVDSVPRSAGFYRTTTTDGVDVVFVEHPPLFDRPVPCGDYEDNRLRFAFLSRAALEYFRSRGERPDVFHAHDWQTGLLPVYLKSFYWDDPTLHRSPVVFTIHNVAYQGRFGTDTVGLLGLPWNLGSSEALEFHGSASYLKGGILFSELINRVSLQYAREIQSPEHGHGFEGILLRTLGLPEFPELPLIGIISRLVWQKGFDIVARAWCDLVHRPLRLLALGTGEHDLQEALRALEHRDRDRFAVRIGYDDALAHKIEAGADMILMPSRFEPCGLTQMYSLRYGTVPVVRATGGLVDTVEPYVELYRRAMAKV